MLVSGSFDYQSVFWNAKTGTPTCTHETCSRILSANFSPDGETLAVGSSDNTIDLFNVSPNGYIQCLRGHTSWVRAVAFSPDGKTLASGSDDCSVRMWNAKTGNCCRVLTAHLDEVLCVVFSPDGEFLVSGSRDRSVKFWNAQSGKIVNSRMFVDVVRSIAFSPDGKVLAVAYGAAIGVWNANVSGCISLLQPPNTWSCNVNAIYSVSFSPNGKLLASASTDGCVRLWSVAASKCNRVFYFQHELYCVAFASTGKVLACGSACAKVRLLSLLEYSKLCAALQLFCVGVAPYVLLAVADFTTAQQQRQSIDAESALLHFEKFAFINALLQRRKRREK
jgi:WD40 repeat protein